MATQTIFIVQPTGFLPREEVMKNSVIAKAAFEQFTIDKGEGDPDKIDFNYIMNNLDESISASSLDELKILNIGACLKKLAKSDIVIFCSGWEANSECKVIHFCAKVFDLNILYLTIDNDRNYNIGTKPKFLDL